MRSHRLFHGTVATAAALLLGLIQGGPTLAGAATGTGALGRSLGDFNGDGYADLAIAAPGANGGAGVVYVLYGSASGPSTSGSQVWSLSTAGVGATPAPGDGFGTAIATGDFNRDGYADLAIGIPGQSHVVVLYGSAHGLQAAGHQYFRADGPLGGSALAAGDFNGDHFADLAVGDPFASVKKPAAGSVEIHYGSRTGLTALARGTAQRLSESTAGMPGPGPAFNDNFGLSLAAGDFNGDGSDDLAIGAPNGDFSHGAVTELFGSRTGITTTNSQFIATFGDGGGFAQASGDFNADGYADLVIGDPNTATSTGGAGAIEIHYGSATGLTHVKPGTARVIAEATQGMPGPGTAGNDAFGFALTKGDFNGDGIADVAVGISGKSAAIVLRGSAHGITTNNAQYVAGVGPQAGGLLSTTAVSVAAADFNHDGFDDLVLGEPFTTAGQSEAGVVELHAGSSGGVTNTAMGSAPLMSESTPGMPGAGAATNDFFGQALAARAS